MESSQRSIYLLDLSDDTLFGIFFSGYLGFEWRHLKEIALVNKAFLHVARATVGKVGLNYTRDSDSYVINLATLLSKVTFFDASFATLSYPAETMSALSKWRTTLKSLNLRGTQVSDASLQLLKEICLDKPLKLISLDLSQSKAADRSLITDTALTTFSASSQLRWLNLSMTDISNAGIVIIVSSFPHLQLLGLQCCRLLTNEGLVPLRSLSLTFLDISGCQQLTKAVIPTLFAKPPTTPPLSIPSEDKLRLSLHTFSCAYLPLFADAELCLIMHQCPALRRLDCRPRIVRYPATPDILLLPSLLESARQHFEAFVHVHSDLLKVDIEKCISIVETQPSYADHWPHFHWPYVDGFEEDTFTESHLIRDRSNRHRRSVGGAIASLPWQSPTRTDTPRSHFLHSRSNLHSNRFSSSTNNRTIGQPRNNRSGNDSDEDDDWYSVISLADGRT